MRVSGHYILAIGFFHARPFLAHAFSYDLLAVLAASWPLLGSIWEWVGLRFESLADIVARRKFWAAV